MSRSPNTPPLRPLELLAALERQNVFYVVIGGFAALVHGSGLTTSGIDITPSLRERNLERLGATLATISATRLDGKPLVLEREALLAEPVTALRTAYGELKVVPVPAGTRGGYEDLRRRATREPLGQGLRPSVAALPDVARSLAALGREEDANRLARLRRLAELEHELGRGLDL